MSRQQNKTDSGIIVGRSGRSYSTSQTNSSDHRSHKTTFDKKAIVHSLKYKDKKQLDLSRKQQALKLSDNLDALFDFPENYQPTNSLKKSESDKVFVSTKKEENTDTEKTTFIPWSIPAALFLIVGILMANAGLPWFVCIPWLLANALPFLLIQKMKDWRYLAIFALLIPVGFARYQIWQAQSNPLEHMLNQRVTLSGFSDGRYLNVDGYKTRIVMSPQGKVGVGQVTIKGELFLPTGKRNPGGFDYQGYLRRRGIFNQMYVREVIDFVPASIGFKERK